jgi:hypothetical protein
VKKAIPKYVQLQGRERVNWIGTAQHRMPMQDLMNNDSIKEAAHPEAKENAREAGKRLACW